MGDETRMAITPNQNRHMTFHHKRAEQECRKLQCITDHPVLCQLLDFAAIHPSTFKPPPTKSYVWAYRWRRILLCSRRFLKSGRSDEALIKAAGDSRRIRYSDEDREWQVKGNGGPLYRQEAARIIAKAAGRAMPKKGRKKTGMSIATKRLNQSKQLILLAEKLHRKADEILYFVAMGKRLRSDAAEVPKVEIPLRFRPQHKGTTTKPKTKKSHSCKSQDKQ